MLEFGLDCVRKASMAFAVAALLFAATQFATAWERPHSDGPNSGFADVSTVPAAAARNVNGIGTFAPGAGPAIAPNGTLYLGNQQGQVMSFQPDGARGWTQSITPGFSIVASPVVDSEGAVYVVGIKTVRNRDVNPPLIRYDSILYKFLPSGLRIWQADLPDAFSGPTVTAPPNVWRTSGESDVVMLPVDYPNKVTGGYETRLLAFSKDGAIIGNVKVKTVVYQATGSSDMPLWCATIITIWGCLLGPDFEPSGAPPQVDPATKLPEETLVPRPGAAIYSYRNAGTPFIIVSNQFQDLVGFTFTNRQFQEAFRVHDESRILLSPPMVTPDGRSVILTSGSSGTGKVVFAGPNANPRRSISGPISYATATRLADGRLAIVGRNRQMSIVSGGSLERTVPLPGESIAPAAASRNHLFVSTAGSFITYDPSTWLKLAEISWVGGGTITPAIGPFGHVYGIASNVLFVFPPPVPTTAGPLVNNPDGPLVADPTPPAATPASQRFSGPTTNAGHRLFACQELDGDDCGKSTSKAVALAFCQQKGFTSADKVDTETKKVKAARLDGQLCTKNKCKVFDEIVCKK